MSLIDSDNTVYSVRAVGDTLFSVVKNGVTFVGIQTETNTITLNMVNRQGIATVNYTIRTYTYIGILDNSVTRSVPLYQNISQQILLLDDPPIRDIPAHKDHTNITPGR